MSSGSASHRDVNRILLDNIPGALKVERAQETDDKAGTDYWVYRDGTAPLSIDVKVRTEDPIETRGKDDLCLELLSVAESNKLGWTLNPNKRSDYILWLFEPTGRWVLIPFPMLCSVFIQHQDSWCASYLTATQSSNGGRWHSKCVFVPRREVWLAIYKRFGGQPKSPSPPAA